jgi:methylaspartate mutase epsilon subunit
MTRERTVPADGRGSLGSFVAAARTAGELVVQPRMGMSDPARMRAGLLSTKHAAGTTVGTITLDSYTRTGAHDQARQALVAGEELNGYPLVSLGPAVTRAVVDGVEGPRFPIQVRHGSPRPQQLIAALVESGLTATEGGPVSYCLPYGRSPLRESVRDWQQGCQLLALSAGAGAHLETFGGCLLGQLCPPSLLIAVSLLEALFFRQHGITSLSVSYAQQANVEQDREAVQALRRIAAERLRDVDWHVVLYAYMGMFPRTRAGATRLLTDAARLAVRCGAARLIVKTVAEAHRIPTVSENVLALESAARAASAEVRPPEPAPVPDTGIEAEARALVGAVLDLDADIGRALVTAFARGYLDVPYCLHPDNAGRTRSSLDGTGRVRWASIGSMPIGHLTERGGAWPVTAAGLLDSLSYVQRAFDGAAAGPSPECPRGIEET